MQKFFQKISQRFVLLPLITLVLVVLLPATAFAQKASGGPVHRQRVAATSSSLCPDCQGKDPITYRHNGMACGDDGRDVGYTPLQGGVLFLFYSDSCGTNWAVVSGDVGGLIENANVTRADGVRFDGTRVSDDGIVYSPMVYAPVLAARACGSINNWPGGCTAWV